MSYICEVYKEHREKIKKVNKNLPENDTIKELSNFFDAFGDPTRLKILLALKEEELCTCDLSNITGLSVSAISHQPRVLKDRKIVNYRRDGKNVFYRLEDEHLKEILKVALEHLGE